MPTQTSFPWRRSLALPLLCATLSTALGCERPLDIVVSVTNLPAESDGLEFMVRTVATPTGGQDGVQMAASTPAQRIRFADNPKQAGGSYTFGLYLSSEPQDGKVQVNVAALANGCPIATGVGEINPPLSHQNLPVDLRPALGRGSADPAVGCEPGRPQIFAVVRTSMRINANAETLRVSLAGWGYYPNSRVQLAYDRTPGNINPIFMLPVPPPVSNNASDVYTVYRPEDLPVSLSELEKGFSGESSIKVSVINPDQQSASVLLSTLK